MSYATPKPGSYRRKSNGAEVTVLGCTGDTWIDNVSIQTASKRTYVRLENFWKKYEPLDAESPAVKP